MFIKKLELQNFRNYENFSLDIDSYKVLIVGKNAQGKTNLLESILYLSCLNSYRITKDIELIKWGCDFAKIKAEVLKDNFSTNLSVSINPSKKKELFLNGIKKGKSSDFLGNLKTVSFSVNDLLLLRGAPEDRRKWIDMAISQLYPAYSERLSKYNKIKTQKNNYLKDAKKTGNYDKNLIEVFNSQLINTGSNIIYLRLKFLKEIENYAILTHKKIAPEENLTFSYNSKIKPDINYLKEDFTVESIAKDFETRLSEREQEEIIRAQTLVGPHRDDIAFFINNKEATKFASQGQQRTIVLSLKLAELNLIKSKSNYNPILLFDDVLAELDDVRQAYLLNSIPEKTQTIITTVDALQFSEKYLEDVQVVQISQNMAN